MNSELFLRPRLTGPRFREGAIPLEVLADFAVLSEMIVEVAKWKYREDHPERKRTPRGFTEGITLKLTNIESGSAIPVICLAVRATATLFPPDNQTYFEKARNAIIRAVGAAEQNQKITTYLPAELLGYFDRFGRSLADGEAIEFSDQSGRVPVRLTRETRRRLLQASSADRFTDETVVCGRVHDFDQRNKTFEVTRPDGTVLRDLPVEGQHYDTVLEAHNRFREGIHVRVRGVGRFDRNNRLQKIEMVDAVTILDPLDIRLRIDELKQLEPGWWDGRGIPPNRNDLERLADSFDLYYPDDVKFPYLFPTPEGRVFAEWSFDPWSLSLEIDLSINQADWHALNVSTNEEETRTFDLNKPDDWAELVGQIRARGGEAQ